EFNNQVILIEDDALISKYWNLESKKNGIHLLTFNSGQSLLNNLSNHDKDSLFFIDHDLSEAEKGSDIAIKLFKRGYQNIYICSGHDIEKFTNLKGIIKGSIGKDFPLDIIRSHLNNNKT